MSRRWVVFLALIFSSAAMADEFDLGGKRVLIPSPSEFVRVTEDMAEIQEVVVALRDSQTEILAAYVPKLMVAKAIAGEAPEFERYFVVRVIRAFALAIYRLRILLWSRIRPRPATRRFVRRLPRKCRG